MLQLVVAYSANRVIGRDGGLPWHLPTDMRHFRELTTGHTVLMGRRTYDSIPERFRPLPGRRNLVLSRDPGYNAAGAEVFTSLDAALDACDHDCFVIGGGATYAETLADADRAPRRYSHTHRNRWPASDGDDGWREHVDAAGAIRDALVMPRDTDPESEPGATVVPAPDTEVLDVAATTTDDLQQLAPHQRSDSRWVFNVGIVAKPRQHDRRSTHRIQIGGRHHRIEVTASQPDVRPGRPKQPGHVGSARRHGRGFDGGAPPSVQAHHDTPPHRLGVGVEGLGLPCEDRGGDRRGWFVFVVQVPREHDRDDVIRALGELGIQSKPYLPAIHLMSYYREQFGGREGQFPVSESVAERSIALPFFPAMTEGQVGQVVEALTAAL